MDTVPLEDAVRARWDRDAIAVYADHLEASGDPRGELVSIDLRIDEGRPPASVLARRAELIAQWFGEDLPPGTVHYGFVDVDATGKDSDRQLNAALRGPGAAYVRSVKLAGDPGSNKRALAMLAERPHPWLTALSVKQWQEGKEPACDDSLTLRLYVATPELRELELVGRRILGNYVNPTLERLRITGYDALESLTTPTVWPNVTSIDFAVHCQYANDYNDPDLDTIGRLLSPRAFPALESLDLSRNEHGHLEPRALGGQVNIAAFCNRYQGHARIATLALPSLQHPAAVESIERTLASLPAIHDVAIWAPNPRLPKHPTATIREVPIDTHLPGPKRLA